MAAAGNTGSRAMEHVKKIDWDADLVHQFKPSVVANPWGLGRAEEVLNGAYAFEFLDSKHRAIVAVQPSQYMDGTNLHVAGVVSTGDRIPAAVFNDVLMDIAGRFQARQLTMSTMHPHMVKAGARTGWIQTGFLMVRPINESIQ